MECVCVCVCVCVRACVCGAHLRCLVPYPVLLRALSCLVPSLPFATPKRRKSTKMKKITAVAYLPNPWNSLQFVTKQRHKTITLQRDIHTPCILAN